MTMEVDCSFYVKATNTLKRWMRAVSALIWEWLEGGRRVQPTPRFGGGSVLGVGALSSEFVMVPV